MTTKTANHFHNCKRVNGISFLFFRRASLVYFLVPIFLFFSFIPVTGEGHEDYIPGESQIIEENILKRMEKEIGEQVTPVSQTKEKMVINKKEQKTEISAKIFSFQVILIARDGHNYPGTIFFAEHQIQTKSDPEKPEIINSLAFTDIQSIEFLDWRPWLVSEESEKTHRVYFFPYQCIIVMRNGKKLQGFYQTFDWLQINMQSENSRVSFYTYFSNRLDFSGALEKKEILQKINLTKITIPEHVIVKIMFSNSSRIGKEITDRTNETNIFSE